MQCVILAAGKGTRMRPLTETTPKPLIPVCGKPILDHIIEALPSEITEVILVTNYLEEQIKSYYGAEWNGRSIQYVTQDNPSGGTGAALLSAKEHITGKFMQLNGDDIYSTEVLRQAAALPQAIICVESETPELFGVLDLKDDNTLRDIVEKPENPTSNLVNTGGFVADKSLLDCDVPISASGELYVTDMLTAYAKNNPVQAVTDEAWIPIGNPEQLKEAERILCPDSVDSVDEV